MAIHNGNWQPPADDNMIDHIFFHSIGKYGLDCCHSGGCWKSKVSDGKPENRCKYVMRGPTIMQPKCLMHVTPEQVANAVRFYRDSGHTDVHNWFPNFNTLRKDEPVEDMRGSADIDMLNPPVTVCTLIYGPYIDLHQRVLNSIVQNTDPNMLKLRIGMNEVCKETRDWLKKFQEKYGADVQMDFYDSVDNIKKYPMMRRMFHDPDNPIETRWIVWLDDDSHIVEKDWLIQLSHCMRENYGRGCNMYGKRYFYEISNSQAEAALQGGLRHGRLLGDRGQLGARVELARSAYPPQRRRHHDGRGSLPDRRRRQELGLRREDQRRQAPWVQREDRRSQVDADRIPGAGDTGARQGRHPFRPAA
jgi:hypothetical protein